MRKQTLTSSVSFNVSSRDEAVAQINEAIDKLAEKDNILPGLEGALWGTLEFSTERESYERYASVVPHDRVMLSASIEVSVS